MRQLPEFYTLLRLKISADSISHYKPRIFMKKYFEQFLGITFACIQQPK
jgi:hypothetical protein